MTDKTNAACAHLIVTYQLEVEYPRPDTTVTSTFWACDECGTKFLPCPSIQHFVDDNSRLRMAVLNQCGDNLCWIIDPEKAKALPEKEFLESCSRYHAQIAKERGVLEGGRTIAQLEARVLELENQLLCAASAAYERGII